MPVFGSKIELVNEYTKPLATFSYFYSSKYGFDKTPAMDLPRLVTDMIGTMVGPVIYSSEDTEVSQFESNFPGGRVMAYDDTGSSYSDRLTRE